MRNKNIRLAAGVVTVCALLLTSCSEDENKNSAEPASSESVVNDADAVPDLPGIITERIEYPTIDGSDPDQNFGDLYLPAGPQHHDSIPLVVLIHGGAWKSQLGENLFDPFARDLASRGLAVYNIEYRRVGSGGGWPKTFEDVSQALDNVVAIDKRFPQINEKDALVVGHSAGAQLAVWGGTRHLLEHGEIGSHPKFHPNKVISLAGPLDMVQAVANGDNNIVTALGGTPAQFPDRYSSVDPIQNIDPNTPVIAMAGTNDKVVFPSLSQKYIAELEKQNGNGQVVLLDGETHTSIVSSDSPAYPRVLDTITDSANTSSEDLAK